MTAICRYCQEIVDGGTVDTVASLVPKGRRRFSLRRSARNLTIDKDQQSAAETPAVGDCDGRIVQSREIQIALEWHKLGQAMFEHILQKHPEKSAEPLNLVTVCSAYFFSLHFTGAGDFQRMQSVSREQALKRIGEPIPGVVIPSDPDDPQPQTA